MKAPEPGVDARARLFGVYPAVVTDVQDPDRQGRVQVRLPWVAESEGDRARPWARLATMMAGDGRGTWFIPEPGDEVLIAFLGGDPRHPVVTGALWNGQDAPPESMSAQNDVRAIVSRAGHQLRMDDAKGAAKVELLSSTGHQLTLDDTGTVTLRHSTGAGLVIGPGGEVTVTAVANMTLNAPGTLTMNAGIVNVNAGSVNCSGVVQCPTLIATTVVGANYTQGNGNVW